MNTMATAKRKGEEEGVPILTRREREVLLLVYEGYKSKEIAEQLYVSKRTVDFHLANIYDKLNVSGRVQAIRRAERLGLLRPDFEQNPSSYAEYK